jgi:osmotically inducible protein OsmC
MPTRTASAVWEGGLKDGKGSYGAQSGHLHGSYSRGSRFGEENGSNPEELLAAAEAACYSMALSGALEGNGTPPTKIETSAACTIAKVGDAFRITEMKLDVTASVPNIDDAKFQELAKATLTGCPVSKAFAGNMDLKLTARLAS